MNLSANSWLCVALIKEAVLFSYDVRITSGISRDVNQVIGRGIRDGAGYKSMLMRLTYK
jgi:hypothetical protein